MIQFNIKKWTALLDWRLGSTGVFVKLASKMVSVLLTPFVASVFVRIPNTYAHTTQIRTR